MLALLFILTTAAAPVAAWPMYAVLFAIVLGTAAKSRLGVGFALRRAWVAVPFALAALPLAVTVSGPTLLHIGGLAVTQPGLDRAATVLVKGWVSVQAGIILTATTRFSDLCLAMRSLYVPRLLVAVFGLTWRYISVLADEAERLSRARESRSGTSTGTGGSLLWRARVTGHMAGSLFIRGYERGERTYGAMAARGYDGEVRSLAPPRRTARSALTVGVGVLVLALVWVVCAAF